MTARIRGLPRLAAIFLGGVLLVVITITLRLFALLTAVPELVGNKISIERRFEDFVYWLVDVDELHSFRDDMLLIMIEHLESNDELDIEGMERPEDLDELDEWGLIRVMQRGREDAQNRLREGEFILSFVGALATVIIGQLAGLTFAAVLLTILLLVFSLLVSIRIVVTDLLAYRRSEVKGYPEIWLAMMAGWNKNQIGHNTSMMIAAVFIVFSASGLGYKIGMRVVEWFGLRSNPIEERKWRADDSSPFD